MDDQEILRLVEENLPWAYSIAERYAESIRHVQVRDLRQEASVALSKAASTYDPAREIPFRAYARACITNRLDSLYWKGQQQAREVTTLDMPAFFDDVNDDTFKDQVPSQEVDVAREAHRNEVRSALARGMATLTPNQREILEARSRGESYQDIALRLGVRRQAVQQAAVRALAQMKVSVEASGVKTAYFMPKADAPAKKSSGCAALLLLVPVMLAIFWVAGAVLK